MDEEAATVGALEPSVELRLALVTGDDAVEVLLRHQVLGLRAALGAIRLHMCATQELDLAGCFIGDDDVAAILTSLRCLERLILDNCQKLTGAVADVLAAVVKSGPFSLSLQRCFGLGSSSTANLLVASATDGSRLRSVLLSHIDNLEFPQDDLSVLTPEVYECERDVSRDNGGFARSLGNISSGSGLRIVALHTCAGLSASNLTSVAILCPHLELLLLGGSVQALGLSRVESVSEDTISSTASTLVSIIELLPRLRLLELTFFTPAVVQAVRAQDRRKIQIWDLCEERSVAAAAWVLDGFKRVKPGSAVNDILRHIAVPVNGLLSPPGRETPVTPVLFSKSIRAQFWQDGLTLSDCLGSGSFAYTNFNASGKLASLSNAPPNEHKWESSTEDIALGLRGAANCCDVRKRTPLHMAAARGDVPMIAGLLAVGAVAVGIKDSSGSTALFVAAESGYAQACELLLQGGADVLASNRAGETPLYIAALRGHSAAVGIMLAHCHERGVNWQDSDVYGDGWTPLMAATVADRQNVGEMLLRAAGYELGLDVTQKEQPVMCVNSSISAQDPDKLKYPDDDDAIVSLHAHLNPVSSQGGSLPCFEIAEDVNAMSRSQQLLGLLNRQNRYGQTALHIAAQKGSVWFIDRLLSAGASLDVPNSYGYRAVDVAKRFKHAAVADRLATWESRQAKDAANSGGRKASKARRKKGKSSRAANQDEPLKTNQPSVEDCCDDVDTGAVDMIPESLSNTSK